MEVEVEVTTQEEVQTLKYDLVKMGIDFVPWPGNAVSVSFIELVSNSSFWFLSNGLYLATVFSFGFR